MDELKMKAEKITSELINFYSAVEIDGRILNLNNAIQTVEERINLRFKDVSDEQEAIELVKLWIRDEDSTKRNWDVAFLLSRYQVEDTFIIQELAYKYLGLNTENKNELYEIFGLLPVRYADYELRKRLLRYYRKAYSTRTFFKKGIQTIKVDNIQEEITKENYFLLLRQDLQHLEDKFRVGIAHEEDEKKLDKAWKNYQKLLSITYYVLLWTETEKRLLSILENISGVPYNRLVMEEFGEKLKELNFELYQKHSVSEYQLYYFYVIQILLNLDDKKSECVLSAIKQADKWMEEYDLIEKKLKSFSNKEAEEIECLNIFFPKKMVSLLKTTEADGKRYELTLLYKDSLMKKASKSTKLRRNDGVKKRTEFLKSNKESTKNAGKKIYDKLQKGISIKKISEELGISRETAYKRLYAYHHKIYTQEKKKKENIHLNVDELQKLVCEKYQIKENHLLKAIEIHDKSN